jgi:hypothetical protein
MSKLSCMKFAILTLLSFSYCFLLAQEKPIPFALIDVAYPITNLQKSPKSGKLFVSLSGGRFLLFNSGENRLQDQAVPQWKNFSTEGFELGGDAEFSADEKYILVLEKIKIYNYDKVQVKPRRMIVLETASGKLVYEMDGIQIAQFMEGSDKVIAFREEEMIIYELDSHQKSIIKAPLEIETASINQAGNLLAISYDAGMEEFKAKHGAGYNRQELKNAIKNKKLIAFFEYPSLKKVSTLHEEVDVVFDMEFTSDDNYLLFYSRTKQLEHQHSTALNGADKTRDLNQYQRVDLANMVVDNQNFIYQTSEAQSNHDLDLAAGLFVYGDNRGFLAAKREIVVVNFNKQQDYLGKYTYQGRSGTRNLHSTAFAIMDDHTILVANGMKLSYWDFRTLPEYAEFIEPMNENAILDKAISQLDEELDKDDSKLSTTIAKKKISGLFIFTITVQKAGEVVSVYAQSDDKTNISMQNMLKDIIMKYKFDVTIPKNERIKFTYTFNI